MAFDRITVDADLMAGVPAIRGLRIPVGTVVSMLADGLTVPEICADLPDLTPESITARLLSLLEHHGWDVTHVRSLGLHAEPDHTVLAAARRDGRVLVSTDTDFGASWRPPSDTAFRRARPPPDRTTRRSARQHLDRQPAAS